MRFRWLLVLSLVLMGTAGPISAQVASHGYFTASDGLTLHYLTGGGRKGDPVILVPGYGQSASYWLREGGLGWALADDYRVFALDLRGHGQSDKPHDPMKYGPQMSQDIVDLMDHLGIQKTHVHGFGLGGALLTRLLTSHQHRLITAIYGGSGVPEVDPKWVSLVPKDAEIDDPRELALFNSMVSRSMSDEKALDAIYKYPWEAGTGFEGYVQSAAIEVDLKQVGIRVLSIIGEYDQRKRWTYRMAREIPRPLLVVLPDCGHLRSVETKGYNEAVMRFLRRHGS